MADEAVESTTMLWDVWLPGKGETAADARRVKAPTGMAAAQAVAERSDPAEWGHDHQFREYRVQQVDMPENTADVEVTQRVVAEYEVGAVRAV